MKWFKIILLFVVTGLQSGLANEKNDILKTLESMPAASLMVVDANRRVIRELRADTPRIPASTLKLLTTLFAIDRWGLDHHFHTDFFQVNGNDLWIKGYGDPFLVSEELDLIIDKLVAKHPTSFSKLGIDLERFPERLTIDGRSNSRNPYDAPLGALTANFNTIAIEKSGDRVRSGEVQTPLTPMAISLGDNLKSGRHRVNIPSMRQGGMYFAELLKEKMKRRGITFEYGIVHGQLPENAALIFRHHNSRNLAVVLQGMLRYSNNFIANQLFLLLGADGNKAVDMVRSSKFFAQRINHSFDWHQHRILEGAGLSRKNRLSARQLIGVLDRLRPYRFLLPKQNSRIYAKTGTLQGVSSYAGYLYLKSGWARFALLINQKVPYRFRFDVAEALLRVGVTD